MPPKKALKRKEVTAQAPPYNVMIQESSRSYEEWDSYPVNTLTELCQQFNFPEGKDDTKHAIIQRIMARFQNLPLRTPRSGERAASEDESPKQVKQVRYALTPQFRPTGEDEDPLEIPPEGPTQHATIHTLNTAAHESMRTLTAAAHESMHTRLTQPHNIFAHPAQTTAASTSLQLTATSPSKHATLASTYAYTSHIGPQTHKDTHTQLMLPTTYTNLMLPTTHSADIDTTHHAPRTLAYDNAPPHTQPPTQEDQAFFHHIPPAQQQQHLHALAAERAAIQATVAQLQQQAQHQARLHQQQQLQRQHQQQYQARLTQETEAIADHKREVARLQQTMAQFSHVVAPQVSLPFSLPAREFVPIPVGGTGWGQHHTANRASSCIYLRRCNFCHPSSCCRPSRRCSWATVA